MSSPMRQQLKKILSPVIRSPLKTDIQPSSKDSARRLITQPKSPINNPLFKNQICKKLFPSESVAQILAENCKPLQIPNLIENCPSLPVTKPKKLSFEHPGVDTPERSDIIQQGLSARKKWKILGQGGFGTVVQALYHGKAVAVKLIQSRSDQHKASLRNEANIMNLRHPNIVAVLKVVGQEEPYGMVMMELCIGNNLQYFVDTASFDLNFITRLDFAVDVASAIKYCHRKEILHLDIKPGNVIVTPSGICKLCDFGHSCSLSTQPIRTIIQNVGTLIYTAPEILRKNSVTKKSDIYSFGITLWQLLARENPYLSYDMDGTTVIYQIVTSDLRPCDVPNSNPSDEDYKQLYKGCWGKIPAERPTIEKVLKELMKIRLSGAIRII